MVMPSTKDLLELDVSARLDLIEALWDSIAADPAASAALPVTDEQRALLDARLREHEADPEAARPWAEVREGLRPRR